MNPRFLALPVAVAALAFPAAAQACAVCLAGSAQNDPVADAFNWSILFMMAMPYAVLGSIGGWLFYAYRRGARKNEENGNEASIADLAWTHKESGR